MIRQIQKHSASNNGILYSTANTTLFYMRKNQQMHQLFIHFINYVR
jgi:hypothetical protein